jgi:prepilin-type N-terminal cleavage/methylation domain-containing protein
MKTDFSQASAARRAFTLIELLVVIAIIAVLAGLVLAVTPHIWVRMTLSRARAEGGQIQMAIEAYKSKLGYYPPDNANRANAAYNQLYYELNGTYLSTNAGLTYYTTSDGKTSIERLPVNRVRNCFGVDGFANSSPNRVSTDAGAAASNLLREGLKPGQIGLLPVPGASTITCLIYSGAPGASPFVDVNPWRYISSNPTNNAGSYDLWVDIVVGGVTNRISNWSKQPQRVP